MHGTVRQVRLGRCIALLLALFAGLGLRAHAEETPRSTSLRFQVQRFEVQGNTLLSPDVVERALERFKGPDKTIADLRQAAGELEAAYQAQGFGAVQVTLPEQELTQGVVRLRVVEKRIAKVAVEGNTVFDAGNVRRSLPSIREGEAPNFLDIARELQQATEHPSKQVTALLRSGAAEDQVDVTVKVTDEKPWRTFFTLDNTGTGSTGYYRSGFGYQHSNLFDRDHQLTAQYVTSPTYASKVTIFGAGYRIPYYDLHSSLDLTLGYSNVNSGTVQGLFAVSGQGTIAGAHWNYYPRKWGDLEQKVSLGVDYRAFSNQVMFQGQGIVPDITVHPASATYYGALHGVASELAFNAGLSANLPGGNDGGADDFQRSRSTATDQYAIARYGFNYVRQFVADWQARASITGQYTGNALVSGEQFGIGGPDSVRGYLLRELANDRGYSGQFELYAPDFARAAGLRDSDRLRPLAFYDFGRVQRNHGLPGEQMSDSISSVGVGIRWSHGKTASVRLDIAQVLQATANRQSSSQRIGAALLATY